MNRAKNDAPPRLLRRPQVEARTGLARSTIYRMIGSGDFPSPVRLSTYSVAWVESEVDAWIAARIAAPDAREMHTPRHARAR